MKSVEQTVIQADRFYTIAAKTGSVIEAVERRRTAISALASTTINPSRSGRSSGWATAFTASATVPAAS